jgi:predicted NBD/HSP70 family sugar kinase
LKTIDVECAVALRDGGPMTIAQLAKATGRSRPTVDGSLAYLIEVGLASMAEESVGGGRDAGRPAKVFSFEASAGVVAGIDVGGHHVRVIVADLGGTLLAADEATLDPGQGGADALDVIVVLLDRLREGVGTEIPLRGVGIGVTGIVAADGRVALSYALPAWNAADVAGRLGQRYDCPVALENDARMASMAEHHLGASKLADDVVYVQIGHRISTSLLVDGRVHRGRHHASGEAGYLLFDRIPTDEASNIVWKTAATAEEVVTRSLKGDADATAELLAFIDALAPGIAALSLVVDPDLVVIGGGLSQAGSVVMPALQAAVNARIRVPAVPTLVQSRLGADAVVIGGLIRGYELASEQVFGSPEIEPPHLSLDAILLPTSFSFTPASHTPASHDPKGITA